MTFSITSLYDGRLIGQAVVCPEARYASSWWKREASPRRTFASPAMWVRIEHELARGLEAGPLAAASAVAELLLPPGDRRNLVVQYRSGLPVEATPANTAFVLDRLLRALVAA